MTYEHPGGPDPERLSAAAAEAQARLIDDAEEWEIANEEGGDGGAAVKLLSAAKMDEDRAFRQGLNRAIKAEDKKYARNNAKIRSNRHREDHRDGDGTGTNATGQDHQPAWGPSIIERKDREVKYHDMNEKKLKEEKRAQDSDEDEDGWGWIGDDGDGKVGQSNDNGRDDAKDLKEEEKPKETTPLPPQRLMARMKLLDDADGGVRLT